MRSFLIEEEFTIEGVGTAYVISLDRDYADFDSLLRQQVLLNGELYTVRGIERFTHAPPWHLGEKVAILADFVDGRTGLRMIGNPLFARLPVHFQWTAHNLVAHPLSEVFFQLGLILLSNWVHDWTIPLHDPSKEGRG